MSQVIKPTKGRILHCYPPEGNEFRKHAPLVAIITKVHSDTCVNIALLLPSGDFYRRPPTEITLVQPGDTPPEQGRYCTWPPLPTSSPKAPVVDEAAIKDMVVHHLSQLLGEDSELIESIQQQIRKACGDLAAAIQGDLAATKEKVAELDMFSKGQSRYISELYRNAMGSPSFDNLKDAQLHDGPPSHEPIDSVQVTSDGQVIHSADTPQEVIDAENQQAAANALGSTDRGENGLHGNPADVPGPPNPPRPDKPREVA